MEILINELSLKGQFLSVKNFMDEALIPFINTMNEFDRNKDVVLKKQKFWECKITENDNLYSLISTTNIGTIESRIVKSLLRNLSEPFWENSQKQNASDSYEYMNYNILGSSLAEACERDKVVISFIHSDFSSTKLQIYKNKVSIDVDNMFSKEHYIEVANNRKQIDKCKYFERKFDFGQITLLENEYRFRKTSKPHQHGKPVYEEIATGKLWYLDSFHQNHYEVFDSQGNHLGEADLKGKINTEKADKHKTI
jgi:hypothetical protein